MFKINSEQKRIFLPLLNLYTIQLLNLVYLFECACIGSKYAKTVQ